MAAPLRASPQAPPDGDAPLTGLLGQLRPPAEVARDFTERGWWRTGTVLHDVYRGAARHPHRTAIVSHRAHLPAASRVIRISYGQLAACTGRFAHALDALGVRPGDPVAFQLPNRWEAVALLLACLRTGAVAVPVMTGYGARDLEAVLGAAQPRLCVVPDLWEGTAPARILAALAPRLPWLRHRAVLGDAVDAGAVDFVRHFVHTPHERYRSAGWLRLPPHSADRVALAVTSLGLRDAHSMALYTPNSLHAGLPRDREPAGAAFSALPLASLPSLLHAVIGPLTRGGTAVLQDVWDAETALGLVAAAGVRQVYATPAQWADLVAARERRPREALELSGAFTSDPAATSAALGRRVRAALGTELRSLPRPAAHTGRERGSGGDGPYRLWPRGPASPLAVWRRAGGVGLTWQGDGACGAGEVVDLDEAGHPRLRTEEVGGMFLVPVTEIEALLIGHPRVAEAAVVARADPQHGELACAVVVPDGAPPTLLDLRGHLAGRGVAPAHLPAELVLMGGLPRTESGELRRRHLQDTVARRPARAA
ncbi:AMP-binding protein [Streptomyces sp. NBC_00554]|uniref:AMP-binding protein n=1 Tax=Streptomyces sp. NBC_00554 TaxID=2903661 RepID=UPI00352D1F8F|nr:AMP-binding protein [Streptomyces sp. NBC_00554]